MKISSDSMKKKTSLPYLVGFKSVTKIAESQFVI